MQEVFEKIIEKLRTEKNVDRSKVYSPEQCVAIRYSFGAAIDAVKEVAAEYNNGWIPCSERLPEERQPVYIRLDNGNVFRAEIRTRELLKEWWYCYGETDDMDMLGTIYEVKGWMKSNPVVAWQPLLEPLSRRESK